MNNQNDINYGKVYRPLHRLGLQKDLRTGDENIKTMRDHIPTYETAINKGRREGEEKGRSEV